MKLDDQSQVERPLRILMVAPTSFFSDYGGHIRILEETRTLQLMGHRVAIVTYYKGSDLPGLDIRRTARLPWHTEYEVGSSRHKLAFDLYLMVQSIIEGRRFRPDIIHGHMHEGALIGGILARLLGVPLVFDFQGSLTGEMVDHHFLNPDGQIFNWMRLLERWIDNKLPQAILTSSRLASVMLQEQFGVGSSMVHPLPDCADTIRFNPDEFTAIDKQLLRQKLGIPDGRPIVAYLGLLTEYQGTHHLIQAAALLKQQGYEAHFLIMGYPNVAQYLAMAYDHQVDDQVTFTGKVEYRDAPQYLALGDIAVAPKMSETEGSGKLLNYMAMAQPIVAYDTPVHREYLAGLGSYVPLGDVAGLAAAIAELLADKQRCECLGKQLRQRAVQEYSWRLAGERIVALYHDLTDAN